MDRRLFLTGLAMDSHNRGVGPHLRNTGEQTAIGAAQIIDIFSGVEVLRPPRDAFSASNPDGVMPRVGRRRYGRSTSSDAKMVIARWVQASGARRLSHLKIMVDALGLEPRTR